jgi:EpsI family protein
MKESMERDRLATIGLLAAMAIVGAAAWWFQLRPDLEVDARELEALPFEIADWQGQPIPLEDTVERILRADLNVQRAYQSPRDPEVVWLYVGYYGTSRGGRPEHTPGVCYPSAGWEILASETWVDERSGQRANEYVVERNGRRHLVHFWYQSSERAGLLGLWSVSVDQLRTRLASGRGDGALVRISTPITETGVEAARERLVAFHRELRPELAARWPEERPRGA